MMDDKTIFTVAIDFIYDFLSLEKTYFGYSLSFKDIVIGLFCLSIAVCVYIRLTE